MFVPTQHYDEFINADEIVRLRRGPEEGPYKTRPLLATLRDDHVVRLWGSDPVEVVRQLMPMIPAAPGYEALWTVSYDDDPVLGVIRHPVLGWRVDPYGDLLPVTLYDESTSINVDYCGVKYPDGRVIACDRYETEEEWFKEMQEAHTRERAAKAVA